MYPKTFSPLAAKQRFDFSYLENDYSKKFIPIINISAFNEDEKTLEMSLNPARADQQLRDKIPLLREKSSLIVFTIPSPFGSKEISGRTV